MLPERRNASDRIIFVCIFDWLNMQHDCVIIFFRFDDHQTFFIPVCRVIL